MYQIITMSSSKSRSRKKSTLISSLASGFKNNFKGSFFYLGPQGAIYKVDQKVKK